MPEKAGSGSASGISACTGGGCFLFTEKEPIYQGHNCGYNCVFFHYRCIEDLLRIFKLNALLLAAVVLLVDCGEYGMKIPVIFTSVHGTVPLLVRK